MHKLCFSDQRTRGETICKLMLSAFRISSIKSSLKKAYHLSVYHQSVYHLSSYHLSTCHLFAISTSIISLPVISLPVIALSVIPASRRHFVCKIIAAAIALAASNKTSAIRPNDLGFSSVTQDRNAQAYLPRPRMAVSKLLFR